MNNILSIFLLSFFILSSQGVEYARVLLKAPPGSGTSNSYVLFTNDATNGTNTNITVHFGAPDGTYAIHILEYGDLRGYVDPAGNASEWRAWGAIYNPDNSSHGCPETDSNATYAIGDLGNWNSSNLFINETRFSNRIFLSGANSVIGRVLAIYDTADSCNGTVNDNPTILAMGVIGIGNIAGNTAAASDDITDGVCVFEGTTNCEATLNQGSPDDKCDFGKAGVVLLSDEAANHINFLAVVRQLNKSVHGIHIHQWGDLSAHDGTSAGPHYNPDNHTHGLPGVDNSIHVGDLGNIQNFDDSGDGYYNNSLMYTPVSSWKVSKLIGRAVVIHTSYDHGNDPTCTDGATTGAAGTRYYFCVIGAQNTAPESSDLYVPNFVGEINNTFTQMPCNTTGSTSTGAATGATTGATSSTGSATGASTSTGKTTTTSMTSTTSNNLNGSAGSLVASLAFVILSILLIIFA